MTSRHPRRIALLVAAVTVLTACGSSGSRSSAPRPATTAALASQTSPSPRESGPSALANPSAAGLPTALVDVAELASGGPPPDGIPAIDHPAFLHPAQVTFLVDREPVLALEINGDARAYPVQILLWHEIVNDTVGGVPVAVTYCPLCNSAIAYDRRAGNRVLDFGTSGELYRSDLVAYDRQTESLWVQILGRAVAGRLTGTELQPFPVSTLPWARWRDAHRRGLVLSRDTGFTRDYGHNPYPGYDDVNTPPFLFNGPTDGRLAPKTRVAGIRDGTSAVAVTLDRLRRDGAATVTIAGRSVVVLWQPGTTSSLDAATVADGTDVGSTAAYETTLAGRTVQLHPDGAEFRDATSGSEFDLLGRAITGPLAGQSLTPVVHVDTFWFAWATFVADTTIVT